MLMCLLVCFYLLFVLNDWWPSSPDLAFVHDQLKVPACSNNPSAHWELTGDWTIECIPSPRKQQPQQPQANPNGGADAVGGGGGGAFVHDSVTAPQPPSASAPSSTLPISGWPSVAYVLILGGSDGGNTNFADRRDFLAKHDIELRKFDAVNGQEQFGNRFSIFTMDDVSSKSRKPPHAKNKYIYIFGFFCFRFVCKE